jgi:hypothetical protein
MWRFRKVINFGLFRTNISKTGVGYSFGLFGLRFGVSPSGKKYVSFGIPNTGLYFIKYLNDNRISNAQQNLPDPNRPQNLNPPQNPITPVEPWWKQKNLTD